MDRLLALHKERRGKTQLHPDSYRLILKVNMVSDAEMAQYATWGGFVVMILVLLYHYEITPAPQRG